MNCRSIIIFAIMTSSFLFQSCDRVTESPDVQSREEIKNKTEAYVNAFNQHDSSKIAAHFSPNAFYLNLTSDELIEGKENIANHFNRLFTEQGANHLKITLSSIHFPNPYEATVNGITEVEYQDQHSEKSSFLAWYEKKDGDWLLQSFNSNEMNSPDSHFENLKELDWLAGNWEDEDENIDVVYTFTWDKTKNFLTQQFSLSILGEEVLRGTQIIGWDPIKMNIRSWTFDSDGGYGESIWYRENNTWYASLTFTLPQGGKASATHIYQKIDDNTYTFASEGREVAGKLLPNVGPFKVIRKIRGVL